MIIMATYFQPLTPSGSSDISFYCRKILTVDSVSLSSDHGGQSTPVKTLQKKWRTRMTEMVRVEEEERRGRRKRSKGEGKDEREETEFSSRRK